MIKVKKEGIILSPTDLHFENLSTFNPGAFQEGNYVHIFYRALNKSHYSSLGYAKLEGPLKVIERWDHPYLFRKYKYECWGIEDPRVVKIDGIYYMTYVVHDGKNALTAYSYGEDLFNLKRGGIISPKISYEKVGKLFNYSKLQDKYYFFKSYYKDSIADDVLLWDKDAFLFPEKINGKFALIHRILPGIQVIYFDNFKQLKSKKFWENNIKNLSKYVIMEGAHGFESRNIGGGCPPIKTKEGWLFIYHAVEPLNKGRIYHAGAALLDLEDPTKVIGRLPKPLFSPSEDWETDGHVHDVVFPTGTSIFKDRLYIYYGTADSYTAVASVNLNKLIQELLKNKV